MSPGNFRSPGAFIFERSKELLKKTITYVDYDGNKRTEDHYFNLSKAELTEMEMSENGGFDKFIEQIVKTENNKEIYRLFKEIILMSYGEKSYDGKHFIKKKTVDGQTIYLRDQFEQTEAFSELVMELFSSENAAADFINQVIPKELSEQMADKLNAPSENK